MTVAGEIEIDDARLTCDCGVYYFVVGAPSFAKRRIGFYGKTPRAPPVLYLTGKLTAVPAKVEHERVRSKPAGQKMVPANFEKVTNSGLFQEDGYSAR